MLSKRWRQVRREQEQGIMAITLPDARQLPDELLQELRLRALRGCEMGFSQSDVAQMLGFARETVSRLWSAYQSQGLDGLPDDRTGRPLGSGRTPSDEQGVHIQRLIDEHSPTTRRSWRAVFSPSWANWLICLSVSGVTSNTPVSSMLLAIDL